MKDQADRVDPMVSDCNICRIGPVAVLDPALNVWHGSGPPVISVDKYISSAIADRISSINRSTAADGFAADQVNRHSFYFTDLSRRRVRVNEPALLRMTESDVTKFVEARFVRESRQRIHRDVHVPELRESPARAFGDQLNQVTIES